MVLVAFDPNRDRPYGKWPDKVAPLTIGNTNIILRPGQGREGYNQVSSSKWEQALADPAYGPNLQRRIDSGVIRVIKSEDPKQEEPPLSSFKLDEVKDIVPKTFDIDLLKHWKQEETRSGAIKLIDAQIEKLTPGSSPKQESSNTSTSTSSSTKSAS